MSTLTGMTGHARRTKIVATIGPASATAEKIAALIDAGMDGARLNFSHGTSDDHARTVELAREAEKDGGRPVALIADLQGPKLRVGDLDEPRALGVGETVVIAGEDAARDGDLPVSPAVLGSVLQPGNDVLIDDGHIRLRVERVERGRAQLRRPRRGRRRVAQGRQPSRRPAADPVDHAQGPRRPRRGARVRRRLRGALLRALRCRRRSRCGR